MKADTIDISDLAAVLGPIDLPRDRLEGIVRAISGFSPKAVRLNRLANVRPDVLPFEVEPVPWLAGWGYWPVGDAAIGRTIAFGAGLCYVQDAGSMLAIGLLAPKPGELICDLCASPGGKSTAILEGLGGSGGVVANEAIRSRTDPLRLNLARQGASRWVVSSLDPADLADLLDGTCDAVLADVPCSGQSLVGSGKQKASCFDPKLVAHAAGRQGRILASAGRLVRPGGRLVYSTCTFSWEENEARVMAFLAENPAFELAADERLAAWQSPPPAPEGCYRLWPDRDRSAGAFAARLVRRGDSQVEGTTFADGRSRGRRVGRRAETGGTPPWQEWGTWQDEVEFVPLERYRVAAIPADLPEALRRVVDAGQAVGLPEAAQQFGKVWQPAYGLAMRRDGAFLASQVVALSDDVARAYLRGESVRTHVRGWAVAGWKGWPLGWLHGSGYSAANKLDKAARLKSVK